MKKLIFILLSGAIFFIGCDADDDPVVASGPPTTIVDDWYSIALRIGPELDELSDGFCSDGSSTTEIDCSASQDTNATWILYFNGCSLTGSADEDGLGNNTGTGVFGDCESGEEGPGSWVLENDGSYTVTLEGFGGDDDAIFACVLTNTGLTCNTFDDEMNMYVEFDFLQGTTDCSECPCEFSGCDIGEVCVDGEDCYTACVYDDDCGDNEYCAGIGYCEEYEPGCIEECDGFEVFEEGTPTEGCAWLVDSQDCIVTNCEGDEDFEDMMEEIEEIVSICEICLEYDACDDIFSEEDDMPECESDDDCDEGEDCYYEECLTPCMDDGIGNFYCDEGYYCDGYGEEGFYCHEEGNYGPPECLMDCGGCIDEDCEDDIEFCEWLTSLPGDGCLDDCDGETLVEIIMYAGECEECLENPEECDSGNDDDCWGCESDGHTEWYDSEEECMDECYEGGCWDSCGGEAGSGGEDESLRSFGNSSWDWDTFTKNIR